MNILESIGQGLRIGAGAGNQHVYDSQIQQDQFQSQMDENKRKSIATVLQHMVENQMITPEVYERSIKAVSPGMAGLGVGPSANTLQQVSLAAKEKSATDKANLDAKNKELYRQHIARQAAQDQPVPQAGPQIGPPGAGTFDPMTSGMLQDEVPNQQVGLQSQQPAAKTPKEETFDSLMAKAEVARKFDQNDTAKAFETTAKMYLDKNQVKQPLTALADALQEAKASGNKEKIRFAQANYNHVRGVGKIEQIADATPDNPNAVSSIMFDPDRTAPGDRLGPNGDYVRIGSRRNAGNAGMGGSGNVPRFSQLSDDAIKQAGFQFAISGLMPPNMPRSNKGEMAPEVRDIQNEGAKVLHDLGLDPQEAALVRANYGSLKPALAQIQKQKNAVEGFERTLDVNITEALKLSDEIKRSASPYANTALRKIREQGLGGPDVQELLARLRIRIEAAAAEQAKIMSGSMGNQALTDSAQEHMRALLDGDMSPSTLAASLHEVRDEASQGRVQGLRTQVKQMLMEMTSPGESPENMRIESPATKSTVPVRTVAPPVQTDRHGRPVGQGGIQGQLPRATSGVPALSPPGAGGVLDIRNSQFPDNDYKLIPSGTVFIGPDGVKRRKP